MKRIAIFPLLALLLLGPAEATETKAETQHWSIYSNASYGFSFEYPESLVVTTRDSDLFHIEGLVLCLELVDKNNPDAIALRMMVSEPFDSVEPREDSAFLRKVCKKYEELIIGGRNAVNCVTCGRGGCSWKIMFPGAMQLDVFTMLTDGIEQVEAQDRTYPLRTIINSLKFTKTK